ncbi:hypothetical protein ACN47E_010035 [Coniothyrium glycines]
MSTVSAPGASGTPTPTRSKSYGSHETATIFHGSSSSRHIFPPSPSRRNSMSSQTSDTGSAPATRSGRMYDLPIQVSAAQTEAKEILAHLLEELKDPGNLYYDRYGAWLERHPRLDDFISRCVRPSVWTFLRGRWSLDALKAVGGDLRFEGRAIYFDGVLGVDKRVRIYTGQTTHLRQRVAQHLNFRYRRDNPSLHYYALERSVYNAIGAVASIPAPHLANQTLPGMDEPALLLNVLEMWIALVFRTLPAEMLDVWLPDSECVTKGRKSGKEGVFGGLNVACPLDNGGERHFVDMTDSEDPVVRAWLAQGKPQTPSSSFTSSSSSSTPAPPTTTTTTIPAPTPPAAHPPLPSPSPSDDPARPSSRKDSLHLRKISEEPLLDSFSSPTTNSDSQNTTPSPDTRKAAYAEKARRYNELMHSSSPSPSSSHSHAHSHSHSHSRPHPQSRPHAHAHAHADILVPQWLAYGTAALVLGLVALNVRTALAARR